MATVFVVGITQLCLFVLEGWVSCDVNAKARVVFYAWGETSPYYVSINQALGINRILFTQLNLLYVSYIISGGGGGGYGGGGYSDGGGY